MARKGGFRSTRAHSGTVRSVSNQCHDWKAAAASYVASASVSDSADPTRVSILSATRGSSRSEATLSAASISADGSTATTAWPRDAIVRVPSPVPAPRSSTRIGSPGWPSIQSTVSPGQDGRTASYVEAPAPNDVRRASTVVGSLKWVGESSMAEG